jgi:hypothetical protein
MLDAAAAGNAVEVARLSDMVVEKLELERHFDAENAAGHMLPHEETDRRAKGEMV